MDPNAFIMLSRQKLVIYMKKKFLNTFSAILICFVKDVFIVENPLYFLNVVKIKS